MTSPSALQQAPRVPPPRNLFGLVVPPIILPVFLASADGTVVATALPSIAKSFGEVHNLSWVVIANLIAGTVAAPAYGRLGDLFGRRRMMIVSLLAFALASTLCAFAPSFGILLVGRVLQGLGGGGLMTMAQALVGEHVPTRQRGTFQGYLAANIVAGTTIGPVAGGLITQAWGWHAVFLTYLPLCAVAIALTLRLPHGVRGQGKASFDVIGVLLLACAVVPLLLAVTQLQQPDASAWPRIAILMLLTVAGVWALAWHLGRTPAPLLDVRLLRNPSFWRSDVMAACSGASLTALMTFLPIYLVAASGATPAEAGLMLIPLSGAVSSGSVVTGWLISRTGRTAIFPAVGLSITGLSLIFLALVAPWLSRAELAWVLAIGGLCQGSAMITAQITVQTVSSIGQLGAAAGSVQLARALGSAFGAAAAGAVLFGLLATLYPDTADLFAQMVREGPDVLNGLDPAHQAAVRTDVGNAFRGVFLTVAVFSTSIVLCASTMPARRL
ncbi:MFS transporter [Rhodopila sp.]|uniref:MFS transporter n=1 Tax=Rhodopila sp. TaxID=2480087 RepID=UPI002B86D5ED|nr:MFS transporter [Rhodopila sp.]HVZ09757.1 MFS transporter [Rhodopila sp.]